MNRQSMIQHAVRQGEHVTVTLPNRVHGTVTLRGTVIKVRGAVTLVKIASGPGLRAGERVTVRTSYVAPATTAPVGALVSTPVTPYSPQRQGRVEVIDQNGMAHVWLFGANMITVVPARALCAA